MFAEQSAKVQGILEAHRVGDLFDFHVGGQQEMFRLFQAFFQDVLTDRHADIFSEQDVEMTGGIVNDFTEAGEGQITGEVMVDMVADLFDDFLVVGDFNRNIVHVTQRLTQTVHQLGLIVKTVDLVMNDFPIGSGPGNHGGTG